MNGLSLRLFNAIYYRKQLPSRKRALVHYEPFFYPLDAVFEWNRIYGSKGFLQYQCVVPAKNGEAAIREILERIAVAGTGSFLAVLKVFGDVPSPGLLSAHSRRSRSRRGTLTLDFPNRDQTHDLLDRLDEVTRAAGGAVYPAKDGRMSAESFQAYYPRWRELVPFIDPCFSSSFWRRVTAEEQ